MKYSYISNNSVTQIEALYANYKNDPSSVDIDWARFFEGFDFALGSSFSSTATATSSTSSSTGKGLNEKSIQVLKLIDAYRRYGHLVADVDPITKGRNFIDLSLQAFGLQNSMEESFDFGNDIPFKGKLKDIENELKQTYTRTVGVEAMHCKEEIRSFILDAIEKKRQTKFTTEQRKKLFDGVMKAVTFENFLHTRYVGKKRFSIEGVDSMVSLINHMMDESDVHGVKEWFVAMPHRGRLNVLMHNLDKPYEELFTEFEEHDIKGKTGDGDVKYHMGRLTTRKTSKGSSITVEMPYNPSHLETVAPIALGMSRAKLDRRYGRDTKKIVPILIHGDAAVAGQGIVYETLNMAYVESCNVGGAIHIVANNQVGFTANPTESRSSTYATDVAKVLDAPVFHVNADDVEAVAWVGELSVAIRQKFGVEVFIDLIGYRRYGHNEGDEPRFTQPLTYDKVDTHDNVRDLYGSQLINSGVLTQGEFEQSITKLTNELQKRFDEVIGGKAYYTPYQKGAEWNGIEEMEDEKEMINPKVKTAVKKDVLEKILKATTTVPSTLNAIKRFDRIFKQREEMFKGDALDWSMGELFAYGSLLLEGFHVRLHGEDAQRGTFSHRQSMVIDVTNEKRYFPLKHLDSKQGDFDIYNSILSEYATMGFEYGYSITSPNTLTIWEGQFGDFVNGGQIIIDQYISAAQSKWHMLSGVVLLLPHGQEGAGPEHSSARLERFLQLCAEANMYVANVTTPANLYHLLRRQVLMKSRKPLVVMTPKSLLRHPMVKSAVSEFTSGAFQTVIDDTVKAEDVKKVFLCSGKVYYDAIEEREKEKRKDIAFVRLEQLYPLDGVVLSDIKKKYAKASFYWLQEEPENQGPWWYIFMNLHKEFKLEVVSRKPSASTAVGKMKRNAKDKALLFSTVFEKKGK